MTTATEPATPLAAPSDGPAPVLVPRPLGVARDRTDADPRPIWIKQGEYRGPPDATLDPAQVEAITERAQRSNY